MDSQNKPVPVSGVIELARQAKALKEEYVQRSLLALAVTDDPDLANALIMKLRLRAMVEVLDPYPFDTPTEEEFV